LELAIFTKQCSLRVNLSEEADENTNVQNKFKFTIRLNNVLENTAVNESKHYLVTHATCFGNSKLLKRFDSKAFLVWRNGAV